MGAGVGRERAGHRGPGAGRRAAPPRRTAAALAEGPGLDEALRERLLTAVRAGRTAGYHLGG
ncbi:hypothetical protein [Streptomyces sp. ME18-1-4]|uniref:hypothetical protein n=1 Tax=Streptomyces sp. ME18-1-4 TaxID=3028685 RepID=UPI0029A9E388|nr:hypothetical protein [Streptomyces sp. ME18-1-4]MDX3246458.1 hypothetical protein [Streptomyces sp. ME18-1-4]